MPEHNWMLVSFEKSTFVYQFQAEGPAKEVSAGDGCEFATECATVYACAMFGREGIVQVCHLYPVAKVYWCHSAGLHHVWPRGHRAGAPPCVLVFCDHILSL